MANDKMMERGDAPRASLVTISPRSVRSRLAPVALVALVLLALASDGDTIRRMLARRYHAGDVRHVGPYERRFDGMRPLLPRRGVVGYLSDRMDADEQYVLTQYSLAPLVVLRSPGHAVVVGNFFEPGTGPALARQHGLVVIRDFGRGLLLLRRTGE
jgi:hypothetical protein